MKSKVETTGNNELIKTWVSQLTGEVTYEKVAEGLPASLKEKLILDTSCYKPIDQTVSGVGRYLIYDHPDKTNPFSIWVFAFAHKQKTSIHDHKYKGTVTVLEGPIAEKFYEPVGENKARLIGRCNRYRFHSNQDNLNKPFVHQLKRTKEQGEGISVTLHIYQMEAHSMRFGVEVDSRNVYTVYSKV